MCVCVCVSEKEGKGGGGMGVLVGSSHLCEEEERREGREGIGAEMKP